MALSSPPTITQTVDTRPLVEPLRGPEDVATYLDRFPEEIYSHAVDSHLVRLLYTLLGPAGSGWIRKQYLQARLRFEERNLETFDLDAFYASPFQFARVADEIHDEDPAGLLDRETWDQIRAQDARYRNRAMDFFAGGRLGGTPEGIHLVARSGLGHEVEVVENYKALYDAHSDDPLGLPYLGKTLMTEEFIVLPRREVSATEVQVVTITGEPDGGSLSLSFEGNLTGEIDYDATSSVVQAILEALPNIGEGNVEVGGGPGPSLPWTVRFTGALAGHDVAEMSVTNSLTGGETPTVRISTEQAGVDSADETVNIPDRDLYHLQTALDKIRPVTTFPTVGRAPGLQTQVAWRDVYAASENAEVIRYVTGNVSVRWPARDAVNWIELGVEHSAPRRGEIASSYRAFHNVAEVAAYTEAALDEPGYADDLAVRDQFEVSSEHVGPFQAVQRVLFPTIADPAVQQLTADRALADYAEPILVTDVVDRGSLRGLINDVYPADYVSLPGVPPLRYLDEQFWASLERDSGTEYLEVDLGRVRAVNHVSFEVTRKPVEVSLDYDVAGLSPARDFRPVVYGSDSLSRVVSYDASTDNIWARVELYFEDAAAHIPQTRFLRVGLERLATEGSPFEEGPWSIEVRNLRVGRNVAR